MYAAAVSFDTHKYVKEFVKAGMPELQAEAVIKLVSESKDYDLSKLATKEQIVLLDQKIESSVEKLDQKIEYLRNEAKADCNRIDQKIDSSVDKLEQKIESSRSEFKSEIKDLKAEMHYMEYRLLFKLGIGLGTLMISIGTGLAWYVQFLMGRH